MTVDLTIFLVTGLAGVVATLAGIIFHGMRKEIVVLKKAVLDRDIIILSEAGKDNETIAAFAKLARGSSGGEAGGGG